MRRWLLPRLFMVWGVVVTGVLPVLLSVQPPCAANDPLSLHAFSFPPLLSPPTSTTCPRISYLVPPMFLPPLRTPARHTCTPFSGTSPPPARVLAFACRFLSTFSLSRTRTNAQPGVGRVGLDQPQQPQQHCCDGGRCLGPKSNGETAKRY